MYIKLGKRVFDAIVASLLIILLSPVFIVVILVILVGQGSPIFFRQTRPGKGGNPFEIIKFRTMNNHGRQEMKRLPDSERLTTIGRFLRSSSLDELPELINVIRGDMSLVGPRPLLMKYLDLYTDEQMRRHDVLPGITGWAQVNGRNALTWDEKFDHDIYYVNSLSFSLDLKIIGMTFRRILSREGINQPGEATAREFEGSDHQMKAAEDRGEL